MATPPPEATPVLKEEKPQLPPSPNGISSVDVGRKDVQGLVTDSNPDAAANEKKADSTKPASVNGHETTTTNGVNTTSPPKSPTALPEERKIPTTESSATDEIKKETIGNSPTNSSGKPSADKTSADNGTPQKSQSTPDSLKPAKEMDGSIQAQGSAAKTDLPHHPPASSKPEGSSNNNLTTKAPSLPPLQGVDQEMRDAPDVPMSPTKLSREREPDPRDEPAAKRTKIGGEGSGPSGFKAPGTPGPVAERRADAATNGDATMTRVQHKFLLKGIQSLKRMHDSRFYREPVDPVKMNIPHYPQIIRQPMDLGTIERRLKNNEYKSVKAVTDDFNLMVQNSLTFNGPDHIVAQEGQKLKSTFEKQMINCPRPDDIEEKKPKKSSPKTSAARREPRTSIGQAPPRPTGGSPQATTFALGPEGLPVIRRDSTNADGRPKRSIHPPKRDLPYSTKPKKKKYQWELKFCQEVLDELHKPKHFNYAVPFYQPVDPVALNIPTYHSIIKKPMDLSTMQTKLKTGQYENAKEFELDMRLIFKNCFKFNIPGDPTYLAGQKFEEIFNSKWSQKTRYLEAHEPHPEHHSGKSESESDESDEDADESDNDEELQRLQQKIAEMTRQVEVLAQKKKKKTPPGSKKAGKLKSSTKDIKKPGSMSLAKKDKKSSIKPSKPEKQRWVTYQEKQIISNGISSLPDKKMQEALKIIQSNVPSLKGTQETEIELDIDELPNDVLLMLLRFVKKNAPQVMEDEEVATPTAMNTAAAPKPKKNKPMSKFEQEAQINMLESNLSRFQGGGRSPDPVPSVEANESSDDSEDDSEESEEE
ncbi:Bromodomain-containing protein [Aspergillus pseudonomiae]|uniref:Bromodomain-containing protein n=1 Tax=Aspergillus pseudonomiae TaxID=1506151 RepID=A0A5N7D228_9EURO|nr:Bromodomain-containing protein [Aspergillus pseudonomiae]KAE8400472.1 Bromodomain-containing protein [Aspergillus pseudonomiae]